MSRSNGSRVQLSGLAAATIAASGAGKSESPIRRARSSVIVRPDSLTRPISRRKSISNATTGEHVKVSLSRRRLTRGGILSTFDLVTGERRHRDFDATAPSEEGIGWITADEIALPLTRVGGVTRLHRIGRDALAP